MRRKATIILALAVSAKIVGEIAGGCAVPNIALRASRKIGDWKHVGKIADKRRYQGDTVVLINGCFELLHPGHIKKIEMAKAQTQNTCLIISLDCDEDIRFAKGEGRPVIPFHDRARIVAALEDVDGVTWHTRLPCMQRPAGSCSLGALMRFLRPSIWLAREAVPREEADAAIEVEAKIVQLERYGDWSSTRTIFKISKSLAQKSP